jgi:hypothetical protein
VPVPSVAETVVLSSGKQVQVKSYKVQGQLVVLELHNGSIQAYALRDVNLPATRAASAQITPSQQVTSGNGPASAQERTAPPGDLGPDKPAAGQTAGTTQSKAWASEVRITQPSEGRVVMVGPTPGAATPAPAESAVVEGKPTDAEPNTTPIVTPTPSRRLLAAQRFDGEIAALAERAGEYVKKVRQYGDACLGTTVGTAHGGGYGIAAGRAWSRGGAPVDFVSAYAYAGSWTVEIDNASTPFCRALWSEVADLGPSIDMAKAAAIERARRGGAWPGDVRDALHKYGIEWDKSVTITHR